MSNCYTHFCAGIPAITPEEEAWLAEPAQAEIVDELESAGIYVRVSADYGDAEAYGQMLIVTDDGEGEAALDEDDEETQQLIGLLQSFFRKFRPTGWFGLMLANTVDKTVVDGFGGSNLFVSADTVRWQHPFHFFNECEREHNENHGITK